MTDTIIRAPKFEFGTAVTQLFNLPGGKSYLFRVMGFGTLLLMLVFVVVGVPIVKAYASFFSSLATIETVDMSDAEETAAMFEAMAPMLASMGLFTLLYIFQYGIYVSIETALYRNIIRGEDKGFFPLRFGGDEFKVLVTRIVVAIILYAAFFGIYVGGAIFGFILAGIGAATGSGLVIGFVGLLIVLLVFALIGALIFIAIRLAPSAAFSVRDEDFTPIGSWGTMGSYFWPTLGAFLVVSVIGYIGLSIFFTLAFGLLLFASGIIPLLMTLDADAAEMPDFSPVVEMLTSAGFLVPAFFITAIASFLGFLYMGAIWSIWGYAAKLTMSSDGASA